MIGNSTGVLAAMEAVYQANYYNEELDELSHAFGWTPQTLMRRIIIEGIQTLQARAEQMQEAE